MMQDAEDPFPSNETPQFAIDIADQQSILSVDERQIRLAIEPILVEASIACARISVAVVDDPTIHALNRRYLQHDYPTDVLSFVLERMDDSLEGQIIVSTDTARSEAAHYGWSPEDELLLYVIHGTLHLVGFDDTTPAARQQMRDQECRALERFGLTPPWDTLSSKCDSTETEDPDS